MLSPVEVDLQLCYANLRARSVDAKAVKAIATSVAEVGLMTPITVRRVQKSRAGQMTDAFEIIAGVHRVKAFRQLGRETIPAIIVEADDLRAELMMIDENLQRNDLSPAERAAAQARRKMIYQELHPETKAGGDRKSNGQVGQMISAPRFDEAAAEATGQSERTVRRDVTRGEALGDAALAKVARTSLDSGEELDALAKLPAEKRDALIERAAAGERVSAKIAVKQRQRDCKEELLGHQQRALPDKRFGVILADPEWRFEPWSRETGLDRSADNHYPTSALEVIQARSVASIAAADCVLFLWATAPMTPHALLVMAAWGFDYVTQVIWAKDRIGTGYWFRNKHELLLVGKRGSIPAPAMGRQWPSILEAPVGRHSEKPAASYELIEAYFPSLPKIELNARAARPGWDAWGLEAPATFAPSTGTRADCAPRASCGRSAAPRRPPAAKPKPASKRAGRGRGGRG